MISLTGFSNNVADYADWPREQLEEVRKFLDVTKVLASLSGVRNTDYKFFTDEAKDKMTDIHKSTIPTNRAIVEAITIRDFVDEVQSNPENYPDLKSYTETDRYDDLIRDLSLSPYETRFKEEWSFDIDKDETLDRLDKEAESIVSSFFSDQIPHLLAQQAQHLTQQLSAYRIDIDTQTFQSKGTRTR